MKFKELLSKLWPLHRTLASEGMDMALKIIKENMPASANYTVETYTPGESVWTWQIPERYVVHEAYLETEDGKRIVDFKDNPLHIVSYSLPVDKVLSWEELEPHLYYSIKRPNAIPWEFKYYDRSWGFCMSKVVYDKLSHDKKYHAVIHSEFIKDPDQGFRIGVATIHPQGGKSQEAGEILICGHADHPYQVNDGMSGVVTAIGVANRLSEHPLPTGSMSVRFLFCPETIGSISYLSHHEDLIPRLKGGIFCEMSGNRNIISLQHSRQDDHQIDRIARYVLQRTNKKFNEGSFLKVVSNDERVINGPGVNVPCISISRWPYDEYHTSDDNPDIIHEDMMKESADIMEEIIRIYATNYIPKRNFRGPVFLSKYGLWVDWRVNRELNAAIENMMMLLEGKLSIFEIAEKLNLDYWDVRQYIEKFREKGLVKVIPIPSESENS